MTGSMVSLQGPGRSAELFVAVADAGAAADRASRLAVETSVWTQRVPAAQDDAGDAARAAMRARIAAERACNAMTVTGAWSLARLAWAAETSVEEASARVTSLIAEQMLRQ
jgi:hypothetical protein